MLVKDLIAELQKHDPELQVKIHPDSELFIEDTVTAYGDVGSMEAEELYFDESRALYYSKEDFEEYLEEDFADEYETEFANDADLERYKKERYEKADKLKALFVKAVV